MKPILIHTHFHKRRTGVTRSIENILPFFTTAYNTFIYGNTVAGTNISFFKVAKLLFSKKEVVVHCHRNNELLRMLLFRWFGAKFKLIATRHADTKPSKLTLKLLKKADQVVALIPAMSKSLPMQNTVVGHGVNVDVFAPNANATLPSVREPNIILCAGRVRKAKGQHVLLEAANVLQNYKDWALVIVGKVDKPEFLEVLKTLAQKYSIENQVYFIKETKDIVPYYQAAKIAVVPSFTEGFSLVTAEAMACGCTVIATKNVGVHNQLITPNKNGYLVEVANKNALEKKLLLLLEGAAPFLGEQARNTIVSGWSAAQEAKQLMAVYKT